MAAHTKLASEALWPADRIDADYRARDCLTETDFQRIIALYHSLSARAHALPGARIGLVHDQTSGERLDLFGTEQGALRPLFVFIHGGYWRALSRDASAFMAPMLAAQGIATAVPDYTLAPKVGLTEILRQCRASVAWLWQNADALGVDRRRIVVGGSSAGGHLAAAILSPGWQAAMGLPAQPLHGAMPVSGLFELAPLKASHVDGWMDFTHEDLDLCSPLRHLPVPKPPVVVAVAEVETPGFHRQSAACAQALQVPMLQVPERNHFDIVLDWADPRTIMSRALLGLF